MNIRLLGPVEARCDGVSIDLGARKQRLAFAVLALEVNRLVSVDRLVDLTWPQAPPRTARHAIAVSTSRLRAAVRCRCPHAELLSRAPGHLLRTDPDCVDAHRFRRLVRQARQEMDWATKARLLGQALGLWRGTALAGTGQPAVIERLTCGLTEELLAAEEERAEAELSSGQHTRVLGRLVELVAQYPYRQRLVELLMLAQYRAGLVTNALATYRAARAALAREMGLDPVRRLRDLERAILCGDPNLDAPGDMTAPATQG